MGKTTDRMIVNGVTYEIIDAASRTQIETMSEKIGDTELPTTAQTMTGAIAEHEEDITDIKSALNKSIVYTVPVDSSMVKDGFIYGSSGTFQSSDSYKAIEKIDITGNSSWLAILVNCSLYLGAGMAFFDKDENYLLGYSGDSLPDGDTTGTKKRYFVPPSGAKYLSVTIRNADYSQPSDFLIQFVKNPVSDIIDYGATVTISASDLEPISIADATGVETITQSNNRATTQFIIAPKGTIIESVRQFWVYYYNWTTFNYIGVVNPALTKYETPSDMIVKIVENISNTTAENITITYPNTFKTTEKLDNSYFTLLSKNTTEHITENKTITISPAELKLGDIDNGGAEIASTTRSLTDFIIVSKGDVVTCETNFWCFEYDYRFNLSVNLNLLGKKYIVTNDGYIRIVEQAVPSSANSILIARKEMLRYAKDSGESYYRSARYTDEQIAKLSTERQHSIRAARDSFMQRWLPYSMGNSNYQQGLISGDSYERLNLAWLSDSHTSSKNGVYTLQNIQELVDLVNDMQGWENDKDLSAAIKGIIDCGDVITPRGQLTKEYNKGLLKKNFDIEKQSTVPVLFSKGNHDCNDWENYPTNVFDDDDWSEIWLDWAETNYGIVRQTKSNGKKSTWHYYDYDDFKVRIIVADAQDVDKTVTNNSGYVLYDGVSAWGISQEQMEWIADVALDFDDKDETDWGVIIALHQSIRQVQTGEPIPWGCLVEPAFESSLGKLVDMVKAFNEQTTYTETYTFQYDSFYDINISADFTRYANLAKKPHVICWLMGHWHIAKEEVYKGMNFIWANSISCLVTQSDPALQRVPDTVMQNCFDVINIDTKKRKIRLFKYGARTDCMGNGGDRFLPDGLSY